MSRPTLKSIALETGLSVGAVSRIVNGKGKSIGLSDAAIAKTLEHAKKVGYRPQIHARNLRLRKTAIIGVILSMVDDHNEDLEHRLFKGVTKASRSNSHSMMFFDAVDDETGVEAIQQCIDMNVDGIIASHIEMPRYLDRLREVIADGVKVVMLLNNTDAQFKCPNVVVDDFSGGIIATEHLIDKGCRRIAHLAHKENLTSGYARFSGYKSALEIHGIPYDENLVVDVSKENLYRETEKLLALEKLPDGVFCHNDFCALHARKIFDEAGVEMELVGFDNRDFIKYLPNRFDTVNMPLKKVGRKAVEVLLSTDNTTMKYEIKPELVLA